MDLGFGKKRGGLGKRFRKRADSCGDGCSCNACDLFLIGKVLALFALQTPDRPRRPATGRSARAGVGLIRLYQQKVSPILPIHCRQEPSCSRYGLEAVQRYGLLTGSRLVAGRISRCTRSTPPGTVDLVP